MEREMHKGDWKCCGCGKAITELPFQPKITNNLTCRDCYASGKVAPKQNGGGERKMFEGDWKCSQCGNSITKLPFEPKGNANLTCIDCYKKSRA